MTPADAEMPGDVFRTEVEVFTFDIDVADHVSNIVYLRWLEMTRVRFLDAVGLPIDDIIARSDLYEREGKDQHAFCISIDRASDVRTLCNIKPTAEWMDTMLHEQGHGIKGAILLHAQRKRD